MLLFKLNFEQNVQFQFFFHPKHHLTSNYFASFFILASRTQYLPLYTNWKVIMMSFIQVRAVIKK